MSACVEEIDASYNRRICEVNTIPLYLLDNTYMI